MHIHRIDELNKYERNNLIRNIFMHIHGLMLYEAQKIREASFAHIVIITLEENHRIISIKVKERKGIYTERHRVFMIRRPYPNVS